MIWKWNCKLTHAIVPVGAIGLLAFATANHTGAQERTERPSVRTLPPVVVNTLPQSGDTQVDAAKVNQIRVTFSKDMMDRNWSWAQMSKDTFPEIVGDVHVG